MTSCTLLECLTEPNPELDSSNSLIGRPTFQQYSETIELTPWHDFTLDTLLACYGDILRKPRSSLPKCSPDLTKLESEIWNEHTFEHRMTRPIVPQVSVGLVQAQSEMRVSSAIDMTRGGRTKIGQPQPSGFLSKDEENKQSLPDWAGAVKAERGTGYVNRCPGETKLAQK
ncbi:hypothetical protein I7I51_01427 [Histoplasma capsulatum]|uniref:Uncharacterized protein n=1 Tax=Ajellomyces capsulatus TaxID=5037 RepID=A0A8A1MGU6_AJECA|nr:hypothetical protein I7I51_01427 [Histoplasma capsulatum]